MPHERIWANSPADNTLWFWETCQNQKAGLGIQRLRLESHIHLHPIHPRRGDRHVVGAELRAQVNLAAAGERPGHFQILIEQAARRPRREARPCSCIRN